MSVLRIIPTRVGTSLVREVCVVCFKDHPHACGDKQWVSYFLLLSLGSSPRVWGQARRCNKPCLQTRIIPTRVGTSDLLRLVLVISEDHPHACGDKAVREDRRTRVSGSSPRVWGQVDCMCFGNLLYRIIPTRVGTRGFKRRRG